MAESLDLSAILQTIANDKVYKAECAENFCEALNSTNRDMCEETTIKHFDSLDNLIFHKIIALNTYYKNLLLKLSQQSSNQKTKIEDLKTLLSSKSNQITKLNSKMLKSDKEKINLQKKQSSNLETLQLQVKDFSSKQKFVEKQLRAANSKNLLLIKRITLLENENKKLKELQLPNYTKQTFQNACPGFTIKTLKETEEDIITGRLFDESLTINNIDNTSLLLKEPTSKKKPKSQKDDLFIDYTMPVTEDSLKINEKEGIDIHTIINNYEEEIKNDKFIITEIKERFNILISKLNEMLEILDYEKDKENVDCNFNDLKEEIFDLNAINKENFEEGLVKKIKKYLNIVNNWNNYKNSRKEFIRKYFEEMSEICRIMIKCVYKQKVSRETIDSEELVEELGIREEKETKLKNLGDWIRNQTY